jgi:hypothetical protein
LAVELVISGLDGQVEPQEWIRRPRSLRGGPRAWIPSAI